MPSPDLSTLTQIQPEKSITTKIIAQKTDSKYKIITQGPILTGGGVAGGKVAGGGVAGGKVAGGGVDKGPILTAKVSWIPYLLVAVFVSICFVMETEDWAAASSGGSSDSDVNSPDSDNEDKCYASGDLPKLQFRKDPSKARWKEELGMAEIVSNKGRMLTTTGISRGGKIYIFLEDALFLAEVGALHLLDDENKCIPLEDIYKKFAEGVGGLSWESFEVYRHLKSLGYIIKRHGVCWSRKRGKNVPASVEGDSGSQTITENGNEDIDSIAEISELFSTMKINELRPVFDVYAPNSNFRKTSPGNPMFILCVNSGNPPTKKQIEDLEGQCEGIPLKVCYVEHGRVSFFSFNEIELPVLP